MGLPENFKPLSVRAYEMGISIDDIYCGTCQYCNDGSCSLWDTPIENVWSSFCGDWTKDEDKLKQFHIEEGKINE